MLAIKWAPLSESMASGTLYLGMISFSKAFTPVAHTQLMSDPKLQVMFFSVRAAVAAIALMHPGVPLATSSSCVE